MSDNVTCNTRDMLGGIKDDFQSQNNAVISTVKVDAGQRSIISNVECKMMTEMRDGLNNVV